MHSYLIVDHSGKLHSEIDAIRIQRPMHCYLSLQMSFYVNEI